ncbi:lactate permease [Pontibacter aydingkolensis]|uniref:L-lactate permease n=1 Tax=Pontibacter aydingkolensis TaxID=1911536 RepID=A0ABS7CY10_9BACT|nr:L-lactate permease [Pontibacter aydingkolensis]MBW7468729.1 L-lactate permease [Pontibacter aydingkolensis]
MIYLLSLLPIILLVVVSLTKGVKPAVMVSWAVTSVLFFFWGADIGHYLGAMGVALLTTVNILLIVLGAVFLYSIMSHMGMVEQITDSLNKLHPSKEIRFFVLALGLTAFFEGVAGFGTPGAIVPLLLIALGFDAVLSVSVVLLFDGLFALFGAVGTPILIGLQLPLNLSAAEVQAIGIIAALMISITGLLVLWLVFRMVNRQHAPMVYKRQVAVLYTFIILPFCAMAWFAPELATVFSALAMLGLSVLYLRQKGSAAINLWPWLPYAVLALLLLLPKLFWPLKQWIAWELRFENMFDSGIGGGIKPLQSPFIPFVVVGVGVAYFKKAGSLYLSEPLSKMVNVFIVLFPSVVIAQLMIFSGVEQPSMVRYIAEMLGSLGQAYPLFAPFIGVTGTFITGSTTISNLVFGATQQEAALSLNLNSNTILALQLAGASLGNAVCLFNIIAAGSVANVKNYKAILSNNLLPTLAAALIIGIAGTLLLLASK